jgi:hypothetical protein
MIHSARIVTTLESVVSYMVVASRGPAAVRHKGHAGRRMMA